MGLTMGLGGVSGGSWPWDWGRREHSCIWATHPLLLPAAAVVCCHLPMLPACTLYQCLTVTLSDPGSTSGSAWQPPQPTLCEEPGVQHSLLRWECGESPAPAQPDCSQAPCSWHEAPSPRVSPSALASGADPTLPRRSEPTDGSSQPQAAPALPIPGYGSRSPCNTDCKYD